MKSHDTDWFSVTYDLKQGEPLTELIPVRAFQYLTELNPALGYMPDGSLSHCRFNTIPKHVTEATFETSPTNKWFTLSDAKFTSHWRTGLMASGVPLDVILGERAIIKRPLLLPILFVVVAPGRCQTFRFESHDEERHRTVMGIMIHVIHEDERATGRLLTALCGQGLDRHDRLVCDSYMAIAPRPNEWSVQEGTVMQPCSVTTVISSV